MIVVDSSVWIAHFRQADTPQVQFLRSLEAPKILLGDLILLELLQGTRNDRHAASLMLEFRELNIVSLSDPDLVVLAARNFRRLRELGITIRKTIDLIIATFCIVHDHELLHSDRDFAPFAQHLGLRLALPQA